MKKRTNKFHQRVLALALALMLCLGMLPMAAFAEDAPEAPAPEGPQVTETTVGDLMALAGGEDGAPVDETPEDADAPEEDETADEDGNTVTTEDAVGKDDAEKLETVPTPAPENTPTPAPLTDEELAGVERPGQSGTVGVKPGEGFATPAPGEDNPENQEVNADEPLYVPTPSPEPEASGAPAASEPPAETEAPDATPGETTGSTIETGSSTVTTEGQTNWEIFYDGETDTYKITYVIDEEAEGDQTIDLTIALGMLNAYAQAGLNAPKPVQPEEPKGEMTPELEAELKQYEEDLRVFEEEEYPDIRSFVEMFNYPGYIEDKGLTVEQVVAEFNEIGYGGHAEIPVKPEVPEVDHNSPEYQQYLKDLAEYNKAVANLKHQSEADVLQPGDILKFQFDIVSKSGHTYRYKDGSFILATPDLDKLFGEGSGGNTAFDGQDLPDDYLGKEMSYTVNGGFKPLRDLFTSAGIPEDEVKRGHENLSEMFYWVKDQEAKNKVLEALGCTEADLTNNSGKLRDSVTKYILDYYNAEENASYATLDELFSKSAQARAHLSETDNENSGKSWTFDGEKLGFDYGKEFLYNNFYQNLLSFVFGDKADIDQATGGKKDQNADGSWGYENESWNTKQQYEKMLAEYMQHNEAWVQANNYFNQLLQAGVSAEAATWTSFMMAVNIDGQGTSNNWQSTLWSWYNSIQLEQRDEDLTINKTDEDGQVITGSETGFQIWYKDEETQTNMYCMFDEEKNSFTFVSDPNATIYTQNGVLDVEKALMKDILYYLQEVVPPEGFDQDTTIYIVCDPTLVDVEKALAEAQDEYGEVAKYLGSLGDGKLTVNFVNVRTPEETPDPTPTPTPTPSESPDPTPTPTPDIPDEPDEPIDEPDVPLDPGPDEPDEPIDEPDVPLDPTPDIPDEPIDEPDVPLAPGEPEEPIDDPEVPLADVPKTGDMAGLWFLMALAAAAGLTGVALASKKREA